MRLIAKEHHVSKRTIRNVVHKDIKYKSYVIRKGIGSSADLPETSRKRSVRTPQLIKNTRGKIRRNPCCSVRKLAATAKISRISTYRVLKEDLRTRPYKMIRRHEITQVYKAMKPERSRLILRQIAECTLPNLMFTDEKKFDIEQTINNQNDRLWSVSDSVEVRLVNRRQSPQSIMVWAAVTANWYSGVLKLLPLY
ncbi:uncharacterized protein LOC115214814 [Octopus sinensis]|uniref:Uncharacterized protein LOC115214814 n=1 Tax=Octopus sinensis TaxID=2607531 RepID=A0A6P7SN40_9MOLL|nr:uncharacterized protein LOC115214814 [Octopus sinensis]